MVLLGRSGWRCADVCRPVSYAACVGANMSAALVDVPEDLAWSTDDENLPHDEMEYAVEEFVENGLYDTKSKSGMTVYFAVKSKVTSEMLVNPERILEVLEDQLGEIVNMEFNYAGWPSKISDDAKAELKSVIAQWIDKNCPPSYYSLGKSTARVLTHDEVIEIVGDEI